MPRWQSVTTDNSTAENREVLHPRGRSLYDPAMTDAQANVERALENVAEALRDAQRALHTAEMAARKSLRGRKRGSFVRVEVLRTHPVHVLRSEVDESLDRLEKARHAVLISIFTVALEDGMSVGELARNYGFSRQRAAKLAKEARIPK